MREHANAVRVPFVHGTPEEQLHSGSPPAIDLPRVHGELDDAVGCQFGGGVLVGASLQARAYRQRLRTTRLTVAVLSIPPPEPVIVRGNVPAGVADVVMTVSFAEVEPVTVAGEKEAVEAGGSPATESWTRAGAPAVTSVVTEYVALVPARTRFEAGLAERAKSNADAFCTVTTTGAETPRLPD